MNAAAPVADRPHLPFRPDIEGMRAVAVLLVVAAHAGVPWLQGGYIGVDVFFVISGYLITGLLVTERESTGRIALLHFYARRLLRLMPALVVVVAATCLAALVLLAPSEHGTQAMGAIGALTWTSNFQFALEDVGYFDAGSQDNLFLHTWSLGVEEQFYLLWPLLLVYLMRPARAGQRDARRGLVADLAAIAVIAFAICVALTSAEPELAFYMAFTRAWQFALGAVAWLHVRNAVPASTAARRVLPAIAAASGLAVIATCAVWFGHGVPFPGWRAALPSGATAIVLAAGAAAPANVVTAALSLRPMRIIGGLSYTWYLWHWPALLVGAALFPAPSPATVALMVVLSLALAWLTRRCVEMPLRQWRGLARRAAWIVTCSAMLSATGIAAVYAWRHQAAAWQTDPAQRLAVAAAKDSSPVYRRDCDRWYRDDALLTCPFGPDDAPRTVVLLGDSAVAQWLTAVRAHFREPGWRVLVMTKSACPMVDAPFFYDRIRRTYGECDRWREKALAEIERLRPQVVVFGSASGYPFSADEWRTGSAPILRRLTAAAGDVAMVLALPVPGFDAPACAARTAWRAHFGLATACTSPDTLRGGDALRAALAAVAAQHGAGVIDHAGTVCPGGQCEAVRDGIVVFRDRHHLSETYVASRAAGFARGWPSPAAEQPAH